MKLLKFIPLLFVLTFFNSHAYAAQNCDEIKQNIVGKLFCKAKAGSSFSKDSNSTEEKSGWSFWKKPEWMKKKN